VLTVIFAPSNVHALELTGVRDALFESNKVSEPSPYDIVLASEESGPLQCASGLRVLPDCTIGDVRAGIDTLIVAGTYGIPPQPSDRLLTWIREAAAGARRYGSVCTGAFLLGAAALLDRKRVTTHWEYASDLARAYPEALVEPDRIFVRDGRLFTSAGTTAAIDLTLALIEEDHGRDRALAVARQLVMFLKRPGGQSQFSVQLATQIAVRSPIEHVQAWIRDNPGRELSTPELARRAGMSDRNFARVFKAQTGTTPAEHVELIRVDAARRLLEDTTLSAQKVAIACGFRTSENMRRAFMARLGVNPADYRRRFSSSTPN
jgi:transcriptional regulator GlxA family with amidase domain